MTPKRIVLISIEHKDHSTTILTNANGDTFTYNPHIHEGLNDFLSLAELENSIYILESEHNKIVQELEKKVEKLKFELKYVSGVATDLLAKDNRTETNKITKEK